MTNVFIGMPVYNGSRFIKEAIESIRNQTHTNWTMLISDDASTDGTTEICKEFARIDSRIQYHRHEKNIGIFPNFKFTLDKATDASYFMWAAQDDVREKTYLETCLSYFEKNPELGLATTVMAAIDADGKTVTEETELLQLSGKPGYISVARYVLQPEILGKCNLMYGLFRTDAVKATWTAYPQRKVWGQDYIFSLALISRFEIAVDPQVLFKKRFGGISNAGGLDRQRIKSLKIAKESNPKNQMFPFLGFKRYLNDHMEALYGTPYRPIAALVLTARLPRALILYVKERNLRKIFKRR